MATNDYYSVLGVSRDASAREINKAYRRLMRSNHPDIVGSTSRRALEIGEAYNALSDPAERRRYDITNPSKPSVSSVRNPSESFVVAEPDVMGEPAEHFASNFGNKRWRNVRGMWSLIPSRVLFIVSMLALVIWIAASAFVFMSTGSDTPSFFAKALVISSPILLLVSVVKKPTFGAIALTFGVAYPILQINEPGFLMDIFTGVGNASLIGISISVMAVILIRPLYNGALSVYRKSESIAR